MQGRLEPPAGSSFQIKQEGVSTTIRWKQSAALARYATAAFLLFWLGGWAMGFSSALTKLLSGNADWFLMFWLGGWTIGGIFAVSFLWALVRPSVPESIWFDFQRLEYDTGMKAIDPLGMNRLGHQSEVYSSIFSRRNKYAFTRSECPEFILNGVGSEQRLYFDVGAKRVIIGASLSEPEREWLHKTLNAWKRG